MRAPWLKWLRIHQYRNVVPGTYLEFNRGFNVLLGRNGTGKTTLLELIEMLLVHGFRRIRHDAFHLECCVEFNFADGHGDFRIHADLRNLVEVTSTVVSDDRAKHRFAYTVAFQEVDGAEILRVTGTPLGARLKIGEFDSPVSVLDISSAPLLWQAAGQVFEPTALVPEHDDRAEAVAEICNTVGGKIGRSGGRFDEALGVFHALTAIEHEHAGLGVPAAGWGLARASSKSGARRTVRPSGPNRFVPQDLVERCRDELAADPDREPPEFRIGHEGVEALAKFVSLAGYAGASVELRPYGRDRRGEVEFLWYRGPDFSFQLPADRGEIDVHALSYGEKRLLAFLWYLACNDTVIADELVDGFHHDWIERCVELIGERQSFLASQNPLLLDFLPIADEDYARRCFMTCRRGAETQGQMAWANIGPEDAAEFYRAYARETQYVSEILRGRGLW